MTPADLSHLISAAASAHGLPAPLVAAMVQVESGGRPRAKRYEPNFERRYIAPLGLPSRESRQRSTSWGLMQIMGETAHSIGFRGDYAALLDPATGLRWGCEYLRRLRDRYPDEPWGVICRAYNGGPGHRHDLSNHYPDRVLKALGGTWPPKG